ncbi:hypothetical protein H206_05170 [Candidatus Electrothrix aarhusensis]|uniref:Uncharacterized protein n=1 Tax=Candidatus Electrothrix aarhusensis TaxID=1859131 RepID=A0A3S3R232_9BACT|nr:hypothetical protein H206_05170 [Candidatus Electrothrix aarhusensis]
MNYTIQPIRWNLRARLKLIRDQIIQGVTGFPNNPDTIFSSTVRVFSEILYSLLILPVHLGYICTLDTTVLLCNFSEFLDHCIADATHLFVIFLLSSCLTQGKTDSCQCARKGSAYLAAASHAARKGCHSRNNFR